MPRKTGPKPLPVVVVEEIESLARILRKSLAIHDRTAFNVLYVFEQLKKIFPRLKLRVSSRLFFKKARALKSKEVDHKNPTKCL